MVAGEYGKPLNFIITDTSGNVIDLTDATSVILWFGLVGQTSKSVPCTVVSATGGQAAYVTQSGDFPTAGTYQLQLDINFPGQKLSNQTILSLLVGSHI